VSKVDLSQQIKDILPLANAPQEVIEHLNSVANPHQVTAANLFSKDLLGSKFTGSAQAVEATDLVPFQQVIELLNSIFEDTRIQQLEELLAKFYFPLSIPALPNQFLLTDLQGKFVASPFALPVGSRSQFYDDLSSQITGIVDTFTVTGGVYVPGSLNIMIHGLSGMQKGVHYFETDPSAGTFQVARVLSSPDDVPLIAQYNY